MLVIGGGAMYMAMDFPFGSALRMGPGYFPRVLAGILMWFGLRSCSSAASWTGESVQRPVGLQAAWPSSWRFAHRLRLDRWSIGESCPRCWLLYLIAARANHTYKIGEVLILCGGDDGLCAGPSSYGCSAFPIPLIGAH
jgi:hypothetical protein